MVSARSVESQLQRLGFNHHGWGRTEVRELQNIILPDEEIYECTNGIYEGGFAMLLATDVRVLLVDKKPLNYLTVEDLRFDMINEIDYNHRLFGAYIRISAGETILKFTSLNQPRLRKLIGHVQQCMAEVKKKQFTHQEGQHQHLEQINQQLRSYLVAQYEQQQKLYDHLRTIQSGSQPPAELKQLPEPARPSPELADYLFAQSLLAQHEAKTGAAPAPPAAAAPLPVVEQAPVNGSARDQLAELYSDGLQEVFGKHETNPPPDGDNGGGGQTLINLPNPLEIHPLHIAYSKLPLALRNRKRGHPFHIPRVPGQVQAAPPPADLA